MSLFEVVIFILLWLDLPSLKHLELGHSVFRGDETWKQNSINFKKLPALEEVVMRDHVGKNIEFLNISGKETVVSMICRYI